MNTERKALSWLFVIIAVVVLALLLYSVSDAHSIDQHKWSLEYEQVGYPYPAPSTVATPTDILPYPAPVVEPTVTAKSKKQKPKPTILLPIWIISTPRLTPTYAPTMSLWDIFCDDHPDTNWCVDPSTRPPTDNPYNYRPTPAPTQDLGIGYPAPPTNAPPYPAPPTNAPPYPAPPTNVPPYPAPGD